MREARRVRVAIVFRFLGATFGRGATDLGFCFSGQEVDRLFFFSFFFGGAARGSMKVLKKLSTREETGAPETLLVSLTEDISNVY